MQNREKRAPLQEERHFVSVGGWRLPCRLRSRETCLKATIALQHKATLERGVEIYHHSLGLTASMFHLCTSPQLFDDECCFRSSLPIHANPPGETFSNQSAWCYNSNIPFICTYVLNWITQPLTSCSPKRSLCHPFPHANLLQFNLASQINPPAPSPCTELALL